MICESEGKLMMSLFLIKHTCWTMNDMGEACGKVEHLKKELHGLSDRLFILACLI